MNRGSADMHGAIADASQQAAAGAGFLLRQTHISGHGTDLVTMAGDA